MTREEEILKKLAEETKELLTRHTIHFSEDGAIEFKRRLQEWFDTNYPRLDEFEIARLKAIEEFQEKNPMDPGPDAIVIKLLVTKDGLKVL